MSSYYGRPVIKEPVWQQEIPRYFFTGGLAGASSVLSLVARLRGNEPLARRSLYVAAAADVVSPVLLISDLGRPERFLNMFRVFKVTSPMSVGSWILGVSGSASNTAAVLELLGRLPRVKALAEQITAKASTSAEKAAAIENYLRAHYGYTLQLPKTTPRDPIANFLFERYRGHCEYFASSMAVMLRSIGIPSRVVNGFSGGEFNDITSEYVVRASDAHS